MTIRAHFDGRVFIPDEPVNLPARTPVTLSIVPTPSAVGSRNGDSLDAFIGRFDTGITDLAERHDEYLAQTYIDRHESR